MIKLFDRKFEYHALAIFPNFVYWLLPDYYTNWMAPPPGVSSQVWLAVISEVLGNFLDIRVASRGLFLSKALWLCHERNSDNTGDSPTLNDLYHFIRNINYPLMSHMARHKETIMNRLEGLFAVFGDQICSPRRMDWDKYMSTDWAISLDGIPSDYQNLFITVEIAKIMMYRMTNNARSKNLKDLIVFDEASSMFKKWYESREGTYLLTDYLAKAREFGIGFIIGTQSVSNMADSVLANTATKILIGGAGLGADYDTFADATGLTPEQKEYLKQKTIPGFACVKDPRYSYPFTIRVAQIVE